MSQETRRLSTAVFGNEKVVEIVLLLEAEQGAVLAAEIARRTGFGHSLVRDVLVRLSRTPAVRALPKTGNLRGPAYYERVADSPLWSSLVHLAQAIDQAGTSVDRVDGR
jgi:DNA-binding IclR family transcriptional regulator